MNHTEAIKCIMKQAGLSQTAVANCAGLKSKQVVSNRVIRKATKLDKILELLDAMGYEIVAIPKNSPPLSEGAYALRREDYR